VYNDKNKEKEYETMINRKSSRSDRAEARTTAPAAPFCVFVLFMMGIVCMTVSIFAAVRVSLSITAILLIALLPVIVIGSILVKCKSRTREKVLA